MGNLYLLLLIGLLAGFTQTEETTETESENKRLLCYHCDSTADENCGEDFEESSLYTIDCSTYQMPRHLIHVLGTYSKNATGCLKTTTTSSALECFSCNSATDKTCGDDNFSNNNKQDCSKIMPPEGLSKVVNSLLGTNVAKGCAKVIVSNTGTEKIITRSCFWGDVDNPKKTCAEATSNNLECHVCTGDLCNGAESITYGIAVFLIAFIGRLLI